MLVTVAATRGSVPREAATRMIVTPALHGTIGGGHLSSRRCVPPRIDAWRTAARGCASLAAKPSQCCGGVATLMFQRVEAHDAWPRTLRQAIDEDGEAAIAVAIGDDRMVTRATQGTAAAASHSCAHQKRQRGVRVDAAPPTDRRRCLHVVHRAHDKA
jgi:xanthine/CO dehydrogenase XdhC/CoxF family maturation factor